MKVLTACEYSGVVRDAFADRGCDAWSCDLLPSDRPAGQHYQGDVRDILDGGWDLIVAFPPCTYLCSSGMHWTTRGLRDPQLTEDALNLVRLLLAAPCGKIAVENPIGCISTRIRKPDQILHPWQFGHNASKTTCLWLKGLPLLTQTAIIGPGGGWKIVKFVADMVEDPDNPEEAFCLDCKMDFAECGCIGPTQDGIEYVTYGGVLFGRPESTASRKLLWGNQTPSGQNKLGPSPTRWKERSKTYEGIAHAMAEQWCPSSPPRIVPFPHVAGVRRSWHGS